IMRFRDHGIEFWMPWSVLTEIVRAMQFRLCHLARANLSDFGSLNHRRRKAMEGENTILGTLMTCRIRREDSSYTIFLKASSPKRWRGPRACGFRWKEKRVD